ncbi:MAG TPA: hypothetical protein VFK22_00050 [Candidatus Dormibacteraeota bacterium]|nr:hypothetical protein [Candidatus Dormibacteraeota bacterium]
MSAEPQRPSPPPPPPPPPPAPPHAIAPYYQRPVYPTPQTPVGRSEGRTVLSLLFAIFGLLLAMTGALLAVLAFFTDSGGLLNALLLGFPAMIFGAIAYFLGRSGVARIAESPSTRGGRATAVAGWVIGAVTTAVGAIVMLTWIVLLLIANYGPPPA